MAKPTLPTNFKDDVLASSMNGKRRYNLIQNSDGTVSLEDATTYTQIGSNFGAVQMNNTNSAVNQSADKATVIDNYNDLMANTTSGKIAGALAAKEAVTELNRKSYADGYVFVNCGSLPNNSTKNVDISFPAGVTDWWISEAWFRNPNLPNFRYTMPYIDVNTYSNSVGIGINNNKQISLITAANWTGYNAYAIVSYKL